MKKFIKIFLFLFSSSLCACEISQEELFRLGQSFQKSEKQNQKLISSKLSDILQASNNNNAFPTELSDLIFDYMHDFKISMQFKGHSYCTSQVCWSPDGKQLAITFGEVIKIIDSDTGEIIKLLEGHEKFIRSMSWDPNGKTIASLDNNGMLFIWDLEHNNQKIKDLNRNFVNVQGKIPPLSILHSNQPDDQNFKLAVFYSSEFEIHDKFGSMHNSNTDSLIKGRKIINYSWAWSPHGFEIVIYDLNFYYVVVKNVEKGGWECSFFPHEEQINCVAWSPDKRTIVTGSNDTTIKVWTPERIHFLNPDETLQGHTESVKSISFSPTGEFLASVSKDKTLRIWNIVMGTCESVIQTDEILKFISWSPDGSKLVSISSNDNVTIWEKQY